MRKLLQNKAVVSGLAFVAVVAVAANFVKLPKFPSPMMSVAARTAESFDANTSGTAFDVPPRLRFGEELNLWRELYPASRLRDPFALAAAHSESIETNSLKVPAFSLQAISIEPNRALAVIDHRVVAAGEKIADYQVERIQVAEVWLRGPAGRLVLTLHSAPRPADKSP